MCGPRYLKQKAGSMFKISAETRVRGRMPT